MCTTLFKKTQKLLYYMHTNAMYMQSWIYFTPEKESTYQKSGRHTFDATSGIDATSFQSLL